MSRVYLAFIFIINLCYVNYAQINTYQFRHLSTTEGLSQSSAIAIHQDNIGQIWIGTRDGLNKYDGNKFSTYRYDSSNNSLSNNDILAIEEDTEGYLWIGTYNGLNKFNPKKNTFKNYFHNNTKTSLSNNTIWTITAMSNGEVWIGTANGLSIYNPINNSFTAVYKKEDDQESLSGNHILSILETKNGDIYIGTTTGLSKLVERSKDRFKFKNFDLKSNQNSTVLYVQDIIEGKNNNLLVATRNNNVLDFNSDTEKFTSYFSEKEQINLNKDARRLIFDNDKNLWIGTYNGLSIVDVEGKITTLQNEVNDSKSLSKNSVKSLYKDKKGSIWIGTYYGGVNIWDYANVNFINYTRNAIDNGLSYNVVSSIEKSGDNLLYFGTEGRGVSILNIKTKGFNYISSKTNKELPNNNIKSLHISKENKLWIGTFNSGLAIYNVETKKFENHILSKEVNNYIKNIGVYSIKQDNNNNFWIGTFGKGLVKFNTKTQNFKAFTHKQKNNNSLSSNLVRAITIDTKDNVWVGTERGLNLLNTTGDIEYFFYNKDIQLGDDISCIFEDNNQNIWVGTKAKGLFKFNGKSFDAITLINDNKPISAIHSVLEEEENQLWISTNQGLIKYNLDTKAVVVYNQKDGIIGNEFNDNSSLKVGKSMFYFGGPSGVTSFNTKNLTANTYSPQVILTDFKIKNKPVAISKNPKQSVLSKTVSYTKTIHLSHEQGIFSIEFAIPNFINSSNNKYRYRLKGLENEWITTTQNTASYTIQNAGDYTFEVKGANNDGVWNNTTTNLNIKVSPAPWRSWWAFLIYGLFIASSLFYLINILKSRTKLKHKLDIEHIEAERAKEINQAKLEFFTNISHEFRTPLTLILGPLHQILQDYKGSSKMYKKLLVIESSAKHLLQLINRLMDFRKLENKLLKLETAEGNIVKFLQEIYLSFSEYAKDGGYTYNFNTSQEEILVYYDRQKLERVFFNLISNAFRYTPKNGTININISKENNNVLISIEDSGVGIANEYKDKIFERFFEVAVNNKPDDNYTKGTGIGLSIAKNIVDLHKGNICVTDNPYSQGSVFSVTLPIGRKHLLNKEIIKDFKFSDDLSQYVKQLDEPNDFIEEELKDQIPSEKKATILLVEDNKPLRSFMRSILKENYNILEAENGKVALKKARKQLPDLIVSDVIMPVMVGTDLCAKIKKDIKTNHIPIILLTSRTALIYKLEGLESGADDYISKPFNVNEFKLRIKNLLKSTTRLKEKFSSEEILMSNDMNVSSQDEVLFKKALQIIDDNISNELFDILQFCSDLGVSRTMLFTKIKTWTNFTPNEFIQHFRMKRAANLLEQGKINVSQVSYKVGFRNPKYFSKCFQKKYGETPTQYANKFSEY